MTAPACGSCGAPVTDARLCTGCTRDLAQLLLTAASIAPDLDDAVAKLLKRGTGGKRSGADAPLPLDLAASDATRALVVELGVCVNKLMRPKEPWPVADIDGMARWLHGRTVRWSQHPQAAEMYAEIKHRVNRALAVIDRKPERYGAGKCECGQQLWSDDDWSATCTRCGTVVLDVEGRRRALAAKSDQLMTPDELSGALERLGYHVQPGTISGWGTLGRIERRAGGLYRLSEALAMAAKMGTRRPRVAG